MNFTNTGGGQHTPSYKRPVFKDTEEQKQTELLLRANKELAFQNKEKEKRAAELVIANKELAFQNEEKEKRATELVDANRELKRTEENLKECIVGLKEMIYMISHSVRPPIANILGLSDLINESTSSPELLKKSLEYIKQSALLLDSFTRELTTLMTSIGEKGSNQN